MVWKQIEGHENAYLVSNTGRVLNQITGKCLKPVVGRNGYMHVTLCYGKREDVLIHRLVANAFVQNPNNYPVVNHKDENKLNNHADNLEWCTTKYNCNYGEGSLKRNQRVIQYDLQGNALKIWESMNEASERVGVRPQGISACCRNKHKTCGGFVWTYANIQDVRMKWKERV